MVKGSSVICFHYRLVSKEYESTRDASHRGKETDTRCCSVYNYNTVNTGVLIPALADKWHLATQILEKKNWKEIMINQKWSLEKDVLHVHALFLQVS